MLLCSTPPSPLGTGPIKNILGDARHPCTESEGELELAFASQPSGCPQEALSYSSFSWTKRGCLDAASVFPKGNVIWQESRTLQGWFQLHLVTLPQTILFCFLLDRPNCASYSYIYAQRLRIFLPGRNALYQTCSVWTASNVLLMEWEPPTKVAIKYSPVHVIFFPWLYNCLSMPKTLCFILICPDHPVTLERLRHVLKNKS